MSKPEPPRPVVVQVKENIELTDTETKIFNCLINTLRHFNLQTELRVAGGWVRDKLLGKDCYDIDIALDNMVGSEFANKVSDYLSATGETPPSGFGIIPSNPDQSKHLETATMKLYDLWIDFVNLRCEDYSDNSRIPTMKFGTAEEDAYRRDLTINSLFYNINISSVEDLTGRGIADLKHGKIVTPLPPKATFLDDPLRVLRAIRFGARFEFTLDEELKTAAASDEVKEALAVKISRERVGTEIDLMISGNQPVQAMTHICDLTLFWIVFKLPPLVEPAVSEGCNRLCIAYLDAAGSLTQLIGSCTFNDDQRRLSRYAALFLPFRNTTYKDHKGKKWNAEEFLEDFIKQNFLPLSVPINHDTLKLLKDDKRKIVLTFVEDETEERSQKLVNTLKAAASANRDLVFGYVGIKQFEDFADTFEANKKSKLPKMVVWDGDEGYLTVIGSESIDDEDHGSQISRFLEGYREGRTEQKKIAGPSIFGFFNSLMGIRSVYIIVFMVAMLLLFRTLGKDDEEPLRAGTSDQSDHLNAFRGENEEYGSEKKED